MTAFDVADAVLFADANMSVSATFTPVSGSPATISVIDVTATDRAGPADRQAFTRERVVLARLENVGGSPSGATLEIDGTFYDVASAERGIGALRLYLTRQ